MATHISIQAHHHSLFKAFQLLHNKFAYMFSYTAADDHDHVAMLSLEAYVMHHHDSNHIQDMSWVHNCERTSLLYVQMPSADSGASNCHQRHVGLT